jgi:hypothetical protein
MLPNLMFSGCTSVMRLARRIVPFVLHSNGANPDKT